MYLRYRPPGQSRQIEESFPRIEGESMPDYRKRAHVALAKASLSMASGTRVAPTSRTVDELAASYLASIGTEVKARTFEGYESFIRVYILPVLGAKRVARLTTDDIRGFKRHLLGRKVAGDRLMAVSTAREAMSRLRDMINYAMDGTDSREYWGVSFDPWPRKRFNWPDEREAGTPHVCALHHRGNEEVHRGCPYGNEAAHPLRHPAHAPGWRVTGDAMEEP